MTKSLSKKTKIILIAVAAAVLVGAVLGLTLSFTLPRGQKVTLNGITVTQIGKEQSVKVSWDATDGASEVNVRVTKSNGLVENDVTISNPSLIAKGSLTLDATYGKNTVEVTLKSGTHSSSKKTEVAVSADEYVIAPLVATMPVTIFSLRMEQFTRNYTVPTFVWLQRGAAWNYSQLPQNVHLIPTSTLDVMSGYLGDDFAEMYYQTSKWVGELYEINNNARFHFYVNDYHPFVWMECTYANRIPTANYDVTLLTDGTASNAVFESLYINDTAQDDYNRMTGEYNAFKQKLWDDNNPDYYASHLHVNKAINLTRNWILPMLKEEPNVKLILTRAFFNDSNNADTHPAIKQIVNDLSAPNNGKIEIVNLFTLLNALTPQGKEDVKKLYKFGDNVFEKAALENKTAMIILGTRTANEEKFDDYVAAVKAVYGDKCVYYYKGHPWTPTSSDPNKAQKLADLGLIDVDSSIAAELLFFFNPDIVATGYPSSTFNALNDSQVGGIFGQTLDEALTYSNYVKFVINPYSKDYSAVSSSGDMIVEFKNNANYDLAVIKTGKNVSVKYYKRQGSDFTQV